MTSPDDPLEPLMAAMAAGDLPAVWSFHETFEAKLRAVVLANVRSMHRPDIVRDSERIDSLTADAAMVIFDRAAGWKPGGAKPWNWAARAIRSMIVAGIGHRQVELGNDDSLDGEAGSAPVVSDADLTIEGIVALAPELEPLVEVWRSVSSARDQEAAWLFRVQKENHDPSPARTVADEFGISPANARQIHQRHFTRVKTVIWADERYEPLRHWDWFAA